MPTRPHLLRRAALTLLFPLLAFSCVEEPTHDDVHDYVDPGPFETLEQNINVSEVTGCSLASVRGLDDQIIAEMNCTIPGVLVDFSDLNVTSGGSSTYFLLQAPAKEGLRRAIQARGQRMTVNTAYRSIVQQYLLYRWSQNSQCGIGLAAAPGRSNHQSGLALDVSDNAGWRSSLQSNGWTWFGSNDAVHYDYTASGTRDIRDTAILAFQKLWNRHNPNDRIGEDGAYGPQTEARLRSSPTGGFSGNNPCGQAPTPQDPNFDLVSAAIRDISGQPRDLVAQGTSQNVFDVLEGQTLQLDVTLRNGASRLATDEVLVGYTITGEGFAATGYTIQSDHPALDGRTWVTNDANDRADNPDHAAPARSGIFNLNRFSPGESKRIALTFKADAYTFGQSERPVARFWVKHIANYYGEQDSWDDTVEVNQRGELLRKQAQIDVFASDQWEFNGQEADDTEGWTPCSASVEGVNLDDQALAVHLSGDDPHICSPSWTRLNADTYRAVALRVRHAYGPQEGQLFFSREGEGYAEDRSARFMTRGDDSWEEILVDLRDNPSWTGEIRGLRVDPMQTPPAPGSFLIDSIRPSTDAPTFEDAGNNTPDTGGPGPDLNNGTPDAGGNVGGEDAGPSDGKDAATPDMPEDDAAGGGAGAAPPASVNDGCGCTQPARTPLLDARGLLLLAALLALSLQRQRR